MLFVILGVLLVVLHFVGIGPPAHWTWNLLGDLWKFVLPFLMAVAWWLARLAAALSQLRK